MKKVFFLVLILTGAFFYVSHNKNHSYPKVLSRAAFDRSIGVELFGKDFLFKKPLDERMRVLSHQLIEQRRNEWTKESSQKIPFSFHQIWAGEGILPDNLARGSQSLKLFHQGAPYTLWTPKEYEPILQEYLGDSWKSVPQELCKNIVAAAILLQNGGVVVDLETECVQSFSSLLTTGDCIVGFAPPSRRSHFKRRLLLSPVVIAATPSHPLVKAWLREMLRRSQAQTALKPKRFLLWAIQESLTSVVATHALTCGRPLLVGSTYFCPIAPSQIEQFQSSVDGTIHRSTTRKILQSLHLVSSPPYSDVTHETIVVHLKKRLETKEKP